MSILDREMLALMREVTDKAILPRYRNLKDGEVEDKGGNDPVTVADREGEELLAAGLARLDPSLAFVGEEGVHADPKVLEGLASPCWIVDPVDGTRNFANGEPPFGILIARAEGGIAQSGWIFDCLSGRFCAAHMGQGAYVDGERISVRATGESPPVAALSMVFMRSERRAAVRADIAPHYRVVDIPYCCAEQYPRLGLGENDVALFERTNAWDHAAGALWLNEAGGKAARIDGSVYRVDEPKKRGLVAASSPAIFEDMATRLAPLEGN